MNIPYMIKKIGVLILLLIISLITVIGGYHSWFIYNFAEAYVVFALYTIVTGIGMHFVGERLPRKFKTERGVFSCAVWEDNGNIYEKHFHVTRWKDSLIDAAKMFKGMKSKGSNGQLNYEKFSSMVQEMCVSEVCHWTLIFLGFSLLILIENQWKWVFFAIYTLYNLSDIIIQRYNRPRVVRIMNRLMKREVMK